MSECICGNGLGDPNCPSCCPPSHKEIFYRDYKGVIRYKTMDNGIVPITSNRYHEASLVLLFDAIDEMEEELSVADQLSAVDKILYAVIARKRDIDKLTGEIG